MRGYFAEVRRAGFDIGLSTGKLARAMVEGMPWEQPGGSLGPGQVASGVKGTGLQPGLPGRT